MSLLDGYEDEKIAAAMAAPVVPPRMQDPGFSVWGMVRGLGKSGLAGVSELTGSAADILDAYGQVSAASANAGGMFSTGTDQQQKQRADASQKLAGQGIDYRSEAGSLFRGVAKDYMPDPLTAHGAEQAVAEFGRMATKAIVGGVALGPLGGALAAGAEEGFTASDKLADQGVDLGTRTAVGAVTGAVTGVGFALPVAGKTIAKTVGLAVAGGPVSFMAQNAATREILQRADYTKLADQYDPFDPVGLALSMIVPLGFGAVAMRAGARRAAAEAQAAASSSRRQENDAQATQQQAPEAVQAQSPAPLTRAEEYLAADLRRKAAREAAPIAPEVVDAARVDLLRESLEASSVTPPEDFAGAAAHETAVARAIDQLATGGRVEVEPVPEPVGVQIADTMAARLEPLRTELEALQTQALEQDAAPLTRAEEYLAADLRRKAAREAAQGQPPAPDLATIARQAVDTLTSAESPAEALARVPGVIADAVDSMQGQQVENPPKVDTPAAPVQEVAKSEQGAAPPAQALAAPPRAASWVKATGETINSSYIAPAQKLVDKFMRDEIGRDALFDGFRALNMNLGQARSVMDRASDKAGWNGATQAEYAASVAAAPPAPAAPKPDAAPELLGRNSQPFSEGGKPFKTEADAQREKRLHPTKRVMKVKGGYALADKTPKQTKADEAKAKRLRLFNSGTPGKPMSAHEFVVSEGGMDASTRSELGVDGNPRVGNRNLFAGKGKPGLTLEQAAMKLKQAGYIADESESAAADIIRRSMKDPRYTPEGMEAVAAAEREAEFQDYLRAAQEPVDESAPDFDPFGPPPDFTPAELANAGYDDANAQIKAEVDALIAMAEAKGIDTETMREDAARATADRPEIEYYEQARNALNDALNQGAASRSGDATGRDGQGQQGEAQRGGGEDRVTPAGDQGGEGLTAPTRADIEAQQARAEQAARDKAAKDKADAAREAKERERAEVLRRSEAAADTFVLGGDPMANLSGQTDIFGDAFAPPPAARAPAASRASTAPASPLEARLSEAMARNPDALDTPMPTEFDADGKTTDAVTAREFLDTVKAEADQEAADADLFQVAANCFLNMGG